MRTRITYSLGLLERHSFDGVACLACLLEVDTEGRSTGLAGLGLVLDLSGVFRHCVCVYLCVVINLLQAGVDGSRIPIRLALCRCTPQGDG